MIQIIPKREQAIGQFNNGQIIENKPIGFNREGGKIRPYSNLFYWAHAQGRMDSTIGLHPHEGFEIVSFVLRGTIRHFDTKQGEWIPLEAGDVQIIRAGNGIQHAEHLNKDSAIFQIWFDPDLQETLQQPASYDDYKSGDFPKTRGEGWTRTTLAGEGSPFRMHTPGVEIHRYSLQSGTVELPVGKEQVLSVYCLEGSGRVNGEDFSADDFLLIREEEMVQFEAPVTCQLFVIISPAEPGYKTYQQIMQERFSMS